MDSVTEICMETEQRALESASNDSSRSIRDVNQDNLDFQPGLFWRRKESVLWKTTAQSLKIRHYTQFFICWDWSIDTRDSPVLYDIQIIIQLIQLSLEIPANILRVLRVRVGRVLQNTILKQSLWLILSQAYNDIKAIRHSENKYVT